jgi:uncharacterized membrane protein YdjX (TVP38/TMEM64 family)
MLNMNREPGNKTVRPLDFAFPFLLVGLVLLGFLLRNQLAPILARREAMREWVHSFGGWGWLLFFLLQILQVVVFVIPGEIVQLSGGFIFGFWGGLALSTAGIAAGSAINFEMGRWLGPRFVKAILSQARYEKLEAWMGDARTFAGLIVLFFIPGIPKDLLSYMAGTGKSSFSRFLVASMVARMPGILGSTLAGSATYRGKYGIVIALAILTAVAISASILFRERLSRLFARLMRRHLPE